MVTILPETVAEYCFSEFTAGPTVTLPFVSNSLPWHGLVDIPAEENPPMVQPL